MSTKEKIKLLLPKQAQNDYEISELHTSVFKSAITHKVSTEVSMIMESMLDDRSNNIKEVLEQLKTKMLKLDDFGAWSDIDQDGLNPDDLRERKKNLSDHKNLIIEIKNSSKKHLQQINLSRREPVAQRDKRMLFEIPSIMKKQNCSEAKALRLFRTQELATNRHMPADIGRAYRRAKEASTKNAAK